MITFLAMTAIGVMLGLRFKVFVLIPGIAVSSITGLAMGIGRGDSIWSSLLVTLLAITALQIGYIAGQSYILALWEPEPVNISQTSWPVAQRR